MDSFRLVVAVLLWGGLGTAAIAQTPTPQTAPVNSKPDSNPKSEQQTPKPAPEPPASTPTKTRTPLSDYYPAYCPRLPDWVTEDDSLFYEAIYRCKYGSGSD